MKRVVAYGWFVFVMTLTAVLPDFRPILRFRGLLVRPCFRACGGNFQIASGVRITFPTRMSVGRDVYIAAGCWIQAVGEVTLGDEVMLGPYTLLATNNHTSVDGSYRFGPGRTAPISLGRGSWTGGHVVITAGVRVGQGGAVAAGAVVTRDVADGAVVGGVPASTLGTAERLDPPEADGADA